MKNLVFPFFWKNRSPLPNCSEYTQCLFRRAGGNVNWKEPSYWEEWDFIRKGKVIVQFSTCTQRLAINKKRKFLKGMWEVGILLCNIWWQLPFPTLLHWLEHINLVVTRQLLNQISVATSLEPIFGHCLVVF